MRKIPFKGIAIGCLVMTLLVAARSAVTVGKAMYYRMNWVPELVEDPWFIVGIVAAVVGLGSLLALGFLHRKTQNMPPVEAEEAVEEMPLSE